jgi:uncharacterized protein YifE (UPF0438 family)
MSAPEEHKKFLAKKDYPLRTASILRLFRDECLLIRRYGYWLEALSSGLISPSTPEQSRFIEVARGEQEPITNFEKAWHKLQITILNEKIPLFDPTPSSGHEYALCPICNNTNTLDGKPCTKCRVESGEIEDRRVCPSCKTTILLSEKITACSTCIAKAQVRRRYHLK